MPVIETYASRKRRAERAGQPDVYRYDYLSPFLRRQLAMIFVACLGKSEVHQDHDPWHRIAQMLDREIESFYEKNPRFKAAQRCVRYLDAAVNVDELLSVIEVCCRCLSVYAARPSQTIRFRSYCSQDAADGLDEVNARFRNAGAGYQYEAGEIIRVDSQFVHAEVVKPALELLTAPEFVRANEEFRTAHQHYRSGKLRDCNTAALRCMETVLKVICNARGWTYDPGSTVEKLITVVRSNGLFPDYLGGYFDNLIGALKAGLPKVRDRDGGHGAAPTDAAVPEHIAGFALHLAASNIVMLVQAYRSLRVSQGS